MSVFVTPNRVVTLAGTDRMLIARDLLGNVVLMSTGSPFSTGGASSTPM